MHPAPIEEKQVLRVAQNDIFEGVFSCQSGVKLPDGFDDGVLLVFAELGVDGEGEDFGGGAFGVGEVAGFVAEGARGFLQVERQRVVDFGADFVGGEEGAEVVAAGGADDVLVEDVLGAGVGVGEDDAVGGGCAGEAGGGEEVVVEGGEVAAAVVAGVDVAELDLEDGGLEWCRGGSSSRLRRGSSGPSCRGRGACASALGEGGGLSVVTRPASPKAARFLVG